MAPAGLIYWKFSLVPALAPARRTCEMALGKSNEVELTTLVEVLGAKSDTNGEDSLSTDRFLLLLLLGSQSVWVALQQVSTRWVWVAFQQDTTSWV